ncbi:hypothetical protein [Streptomyces sp. NPDC086787]|uniref:hypothetical protein n=1 Tax=Streptomyces sp. NPDC086787 TaxID=3365759 RepID=UPI00382A66DB
MHTSSRRFIGDAARDLARLLPGQWHASVEVYSHPDWQQDLAPRIWDSGELGRAFESDRIPFAAADRRARALGVPARSIFAVTKERRSTFDGNRSDFAVTGVRHEALRNRVEVEDLLLQAVAAVW